MALNDAGLNAMGDGLAAVVTHASIHTADPGTTGTSESSAGRQAVTISVSAAGVMTLTNVAFTGGASSGAVFSIGFWDASTAGNFYGDQAIETGDTTFNAAGEFTVTSMTITPTSSD